VRILGFGPAFWIRKYAREATRIFCQDFRLNDYFLGKRHKTRKREQL